jgi:hypothetical protein
LNCHHLVVPAACCGLAGQRQQLGVKQLIHLACSLAECLALASLFSYYEVYVERNL